MRKDSDEGKVKYPFAKYDSGFKRAKYFLDKFEKMKTSKRPFQFIMVRQLPNGKGLFNTNIKVSMEDYQIKEDSKEGFDVTVTIKLKQYRDFGTKTCNIKFAKTKSTVQKEKKRETTNSPAPSSNKVRSPKRRKGDKMRLCHAVFKGNVVFPVYIFDTGRMLLVGFFRFKG